MFTDMQLAFTQYETNHIIETGLSPTGIQT